MRRNRHRRNRLLPSFTDLRQVVGVDAIARPSAASLDPATLGTIFTDVYFHTQYSNLWRDVDGTLPCTTDGQLCRRVDDLSASGNNAVFNTAGDTPRFHLNGSVKTIGDFAANSAFLDLVSPLTYLSQYTVILLVASHDGATDCHFPIGFTDNYMYHLLDEAVWSYDATVGNKAADIPDSATPVLLMWWRGALDTYFAATGLPTTEGFEIVGNPGGMNKFGGADDPGRYCTKDIIAFGAVGADVSAQGPAIAAALGTTLTL